jgi:spore germination cell wall hydrolase CwlJ-like protein
MLGLLPLGVIASCTQPLHVSEAAAPAGQFPMARAIDIALPDLPALDYSTDRLLQDASLTWRRSPAAPAIEARSLDCLTEAVYYEARSEPLDGQRAVAQVVLNRTGRPGFSNSVCGVIRQRSVSGGGCQFAFVCNGVMLARREARAWAEAREVARRSLSGAAFALIGTATFYHRADVRPDWSARFKRVAQVGSQIFYRS